eukprot:SAG31_NODE_1140_length_9701_cov_43.848261_2_plen_170_part_00
MRRISAPRSKRQQLDATQEVKHHCQEVAVWEDILVWLDVGVPPSSSREWRTSGPHPFSKRESNVKPKNDRSGANSCCEELPFLGHLVELNRRVRATTTTVDQHSASPGSSVTTLRHLRLALYTLRRILSGRPKAKEIKNIFTNAVGITILAATSKELQTSRRSLTHGML